MVSHSIIEFVASTWGYCTPTIPKPLILSDKPSTIIIGFLHSRYHSAILWVVGPLTTSKRHFSRKTWSLASLVYVDSSSRHSGLILDFLFWEVMAPPLASPTAQLLPIRVYLRCTKSPAGVCVARQSNINIICVWFDLRFGVGLEEIERLDEILQLKLLACWFH